MKKHAVFRAMIDPILLFGVPFKYIMVAVGVTVLMVISPLKWFAAPFFIVAFVYAKVQQRRDPRWMVIIARRLKLRLPAFVARKRDYVA